MVIATSIPFLASYILLWLLLLTLTVLVILLYRHFGLVALGTLEGVQRDGLPVGEAAPKIVGLTAEGEPAEWDPGLANTLLLFASPSCEPCAEILPYVNALANRVGGNALSTVAVVAGPSEVAATLVEKFSPTFPCIAGNGEQTFDRYRVRVTPFAFVVGKDGRVHAKGLCDKAIRLRGLLEAGGLDEEATALDSILPSMTGIRQEVLT